MVKIDPTKIHISKININCVLGDRNLKKIIIRLKKELLTLINN